MDKSLSSDSPVPGVPNPAPPCAQIGLRARLALYVGMWVVFAVILLSFRDADGQSVVHWHSGDLPMLPLFVLYHAVTGMLFAVDASVDATVSQWIITLLLVMPAVAYIGLGILMMMAHRAQTFAITYAINIALLAIAAAGAHEYLANID